MKLIKERYNLENKFRIYNLDSVNMIIERKPSFISFGYAYLITINDEIIDLYFQDKNIIRQILGIQWNDPMYLLRKDEILFDGY